MNFIRVSCLIAQTQCLTNVWMNINRVKLQRDRELTMFGAFWIIIIIIIIKIINFIRVSCLIAQTQCLTIVWMNINRVKLQRDRELTMFGAFWIIIIIIIIKIINFIRVSCLIAQTQCLTIVWMNINRVKLQRDRELNMFRSYFPLFMVLLCDILYRRMRGILSTLACDVLLYVRLKTTCAAVKLRQRQLTIR